MPKKSSCKKPAPRPGKPVMKDNGPSSTPKKPGNDIDEIFSTKKRKKTEQEKAGKQVEDESAKANKLKKRKNKRIEPEEKNYLDPPTRPSEKTGKGFFVPTSEDLGLWKSDAGGMEKNGETVLMRWNPEADKCFLDTCIQEVTKRGRQGGSLCAVSWTTIMEVLKENYDFVVSQRQMKNRYDYLKRKYRAWLMLKTSHIIDHGTNKINMTNSEWQEYIKTRPKAKEAKSLKLAPLLYPELCAILFEPDNEGIEVDEHEENSDPSNSKEQDLGMEENGGTVLTNGGTVLTRWNQEVDKCFLEKCIQEVSKRGRRGGSLCMASWTTIMDVLKEDHNFVVSQRQMKNRYDYLKRKYQAWLKLKTNKINMTNSEWQDYIKIHSNAKDVKALKQAPLLYPELCTTLFEGTILTGVDALGPNCRHQDLDDNSSNSRNVDIQVDEHEGNSNPSNSKDQDLGINSSPSNSRNIEQLQLVEQAGNSNPSSHGIHSKASGPPSKGNKPEIKSNGQPSSSENILEAVSHAFTLAFKNHRGPSVTDCISKLNEVGWDKEDDLYVSAIVIFGNSAGHREAWMNLPKDNVGLVTSWIKKVGQTMGLTF